MPDRVVFDCMLFLQAVVSEQGPAFQYRILQKHLPSRAIRRMNPTPIWRSL